MYGGRCTGLHCTALHCPLVLHCPVPCLPRPCPPLPSPSHPSTPSVQVRGQGAGLASAAIIAVVPSYISRSVAGSYDLEAVAIFALVFVFYLYVKVCAGGAEGSTGS